MSLKPNDDEEALSLSKIHLSDDQFDVFAESEQQNSAKIDSKAITMSKNSNEKSFIAFMRPRSPHSSKKKNRKSRSGIQEKARMTGGGDCSKSAGRRSAKNNVSLSMTDVKCDASVPRTLQSSRKKRSGCKRVVSSRDEMSGDCPEKLSLPPCQINKTDIYTELSVTMQKLFEDISKKKYCFDTMQRITNIGIDLWMTYDQDFVTSMDAFKIAADCLLQTTTEVDIRIRSHFLKVFRIVFLFTEDIDNAMRYMYSLEFKRDSTDVTLPQLDKYYDEFDEFLSKIIMQISNSECQLNEDLRREFSFFLTISPRVLLRHIVVSYVRKSQSYDIIRITQLLRTIPAFCELRFGLSNCPSISRSVITALIYGFFMSFGMKIYDDVNFYNEEHRHRLIYVLKLLTTTRTRVGDGTTLFEPVFDPNDLVVDFVCQQFLPNASHDPVNLHFALDLVHKLLVSRIKTYGSQKINSFVRDEVVIRWRNSYSSGDLAVDIGILMHHLSNLCMTKKSLDITIRQKCLSLLQYLGIIVEELVISHQFALTQGPASELRRNNNNKSIEMYNFVKMKGVSKYLS